MEGFRKVVKCEGMICDHNSSDKKPRLTFILALSQHHNITFAQTSQNYVPKTLFDNVCITKRNGRCRSNVHLFQADKPIEWVYIQSQLCSNYISVFVFKCFLNWEGSKFCIFIYNVRNVYVVAAISFIINNNNNNNIIIIIILLYNYFINIKLFIL